MPVYIYKMRALGYPPGWMAEAQKTEAPGLAMFGKDGTGEFFCCFFFFFFYSVLRTFQDYFSSYETGQLVGGAKTGEPREKTPDTPANRTWLVSHVARAGLEPTPDTAVR